MPLESCSVIIAGGGPCGLMLANELGRRNISTVLIDEKPGTAFNPQANATQARTMEHFRRHGFADEIRALGLPPDYPTDIAYFTRFAKYELARFSLPSSGEAKKKVTALSGSWSAAELPHRVSQKWVEAVLFKHANTQPSVSLNYGWRLLHFSDHGNAVLAEVEQVSGGRRQTIRASYLVGADGARSLVRRTLGIDYQGETGAVRDFMGGRMHAMYLRAPRFYEVSGHAPAWMNVTFNRDRRAYMAAVDGKEEFAFHTQLRDHEIDSEITSADAVRMFHAAMGAPLDIEILSRASWIAGRTLVAEKFQHERIFLGGDAAHLFTPAGGLGYNTAIEDAVNLGWKLAAVLKAQAPAHLLQTYELERQPAALRNTGYARRFADSLGDNVAPPELEDDTEAGAMARRRAGEHFHTHARIEFDIPGVTFGYRYDGSPIIVADKTSPPPDSANVYIPTACPGGRPPHVWLQAGRSLYDSFGFEWTLLRLGPQAPDSAGFEGAAAAKGLDLRVVHIPLDEVRDMYEADFALIRPDQIVAWRGDAPKSDADDILKRVTGRQLSQ